MADITLGRGSLLFWIIFSVILWSIWKYVIKARFKDEVNE